MASSAQPASGSSSAPSVSLPSGVTGNAIQDFYGQALAQLQPTIQAEEAPLQTYQSQIPSLYGNLITGQQNLETATNNLYGSQLSNLQTQGQVAQQQSRAGLSNSLGQQRAQEGASGMGYSSVARSQEASITNQVQSAINDYMLQLSGQENTLVNQQAVAIQNIVNNIAGITLDEAKDSMQVASQIAAIQGQGVMSALSYASQMESANMSYSIQAGQLDEAIRHDQATEQIQGVQAQAALAEAGAAGGEASAAEANAATNAQQLTLQKQEQAQGEETQSSTTDAPSLSNLFGLLPHTSKETTLKGIGQ